MSQIRLHLREAEGDLPDVCMRCGEEATLTKYKKLSWCPPWVGALILAGLLPYAIVASIMTKRVRVAAPLCERHKGHWLYRQLLMWGSFFLFGFLILFGIILGNLLPRRFQDTAFGVVAISGFVLFIAWLIIVIVAQSTAIRAKEITDTEILLDGVADAFVDAVAAADQARLARRRKRRRSWEDDEDEEEERPRPRKKRPSSEAFEE